MYTPRHPVRSIVIMASALLALFLLSFVVGRYGVPLGQVVRILLSGMLPLEQTWTDNMAIAVLNVRLPRILLACLVGCGLSAAGTGYQTVFQNPMAAPDILGASSGACFGAALAILTGQSAVMITVFAFLASLLSVALVYLVGNHTRGNRVVNLLLAGIMWVGCSPPARLISSWWPTPPTSCPRSPTGSWAACPVRGWARCGSPPSAWRWGWCPCSCCGGG